jgi:hypothetical protein
MIHNNALNVVFLVIGRFAVLSLSFFQLFLEVSKTIKLKYFFFIFYEFIISTIKKPEKKNRLELCGDSELLNKVRKCENGST